MKFRPTEFLNTPYRVSCYIKLYGELISCMRPRLMQDMVDRVDEWLLQTLTWSTLQINQFKSPI